MNSFGRSVYSTRRLEKRRKLAAVDLAAGKLSICEISYRYEVSRTTVYRWKIALEKGGSLDAKPHTGRPRWVPRADLVKLWRENQTLSTKEFSALITARFSVEYVIDHVGRMMKRFRSEVKVDAATA